MPIEESSNTDNLPKILLTEEKTICTLMFQEQDIKKSKVEVETKDGKAKWSRYDIEDMIVYDENGDEQDEGTNDIPWYAMADFEACYNKLKKNDKKGDIIFSFRRTKNGNKNKFKFEVDL